MNFHSDWSSIDRLEFKWSTVELAQPHYSVCEEQETVALDVIRRGNLAESSFVTVKVGKSFVIWNGITSNYNLVINK